MRGSLLNLLIVSAVLLTGFQGMAEGAPQNTSMNKAGQYSEREMVKGKEFLVKSAEASGGLTRLKSAINSTMSCVVESASQKKLNYKEIRVFPNKIAKFIPTPTGQNEYYFNGTDGWIISEGSTQQMPPLMAGREADQFKRDQVYLLTHAGNDDLTVAYKGDEPFEGISCHRLEIVLNPSEVYSVYVNTESYLLIGMKLETVSAMGPTTVTMELHDYKEFDGIKLPSRITQNVGTQTVKVTEIEYSFNDEINLKIFEKPEGL